MSNRTLGIDLRRVFDTVAWSSDIAADHCHNRQVKAPTSLTEPQRARSQRVITIALGLIAVVAVPPLVLLWIFAITNYWGPEFSQVWPVTIMWTATWTCLGIVVMYRIRTLCGLREGIATPERSIG